MQKIYKITINDLTIEVIQDNDGKFIKPSIIDDYNSFGTALKPAYEPIIVARKPMKTSVAENVLKNRVGGINIDECRVGNEKIKGGTMPKMSDGELGVCNYKTVGAKRIEREDNIGRFPANIIHDGSEEVVSGFPSEAGGTLRSEKNNKDTEYTNTYTPAKSQYSSENTYGDSGNASRFFYTAKASKKDRDEGLEAFDKIKVNDGRKTEIDNALQRGETPRKNIHPTVKPIELMQYLVRLVAPKGATILDCFMGSNSTGKAVMFENRERNANYKFIGIELTDEYLPICEARIEYAINKYEYDEKLEQAKTGQLSIFDFVGEEDE